MSEPQEFTLEELITLKNEIHHALRAWHEVPSEGVADALICNLYDKYAVKFGIDPLKDLK